MGYSGRKKAKRGRKKSKRAFVRHPVQNVCQSCGNVFEWYRGTPQRCSGCLASGVSFGR